MGNKCCQRELDENSFDITMEKYKDKMPESFILNEQNDGLDEIIADVAIFLQKNDDGKDAPGTKHKPEESHDIKYIRNFPLVYSNMFLQLEKKFGKWCVQKEDRDDQFPVENSGSVVIEMVSQVKLNQILGKSKSQQLSVQNLDTLETKENLQLAYYQGEWRREMMHGYGKLCTEDGSAYEGNFKAGLPHGRGRVAYANGDVLEGNFKLGFVDGISKLYTNEGVEIFGQFKRNVLEGNGRFNYLIRG